MSLKLQVDRILALNSPAELKLQLGCGHNMLPGWINTDGTPPPDADYLDCSRAFPFASNVLAAVFCEHTIEHITKAEGQRLVEEAFRILKPNGFLRIVTPSLDSFSRMVLDPQSSAAEKYLQFVRGFTNDAAATIADAMNLVFYGHGHRYLYTADALTNLLRHAGFAAIQVMAAGSYGNPIFDGVDGHGRLVGDEINAIEAMAVEAQKP